VNLANRITVGRLGLSIALFVLLANLEVPSEHALAWLSVALVTFITVCVTDALDGYYARKYNEISDFGRVADPAVDKVSVSGTLIFLAAAEWAQPVLAPWMVVVIVSREFTINGLRGFVESRGIRFGSDWSGKLKMIMQSIAIPAVFFFKIVEIGLPSVDWAVIGSRWLAIVTVWAALVLTVYSGVEYIVKATRLLKSTAG
jgi:CDP-diacylglycerol---glycerol-3-phosphate 3-phosphatidyltransferase